MNEQRIHLNTNMKHIIKTIFIFILVLNYAFADLFHQVRVFDSSQDARQSFHEMGIPTDHIRIKKDVFIDLTVSDLQLTRLQEAGFVYEILQEDLSQYFQERSISSPEREFPLGSMLGNYTWDELNTRMDDLRDLYPDLISEKYIIGTSVEGREIWAVKVSDNPNQDEVEPKVLFTGLTHAREPLGMMNLFYFIQLLCENYGTDSELTYLVNEREMWFLPVVNPDGYVYNESIEPNGGGMHRKNRSDSNCGNGTTRGIDLNRNYGYNWGLDDQGSSPDSCSDTYRGSEAFSEPETQAVRNFISNHPFKDVLHYHSFSNVLIHSFGDASLPLEPDLSTLREIGEEMTRHNGYPVGTGFELIGYTVNGDAVDWTYGDQGIISYTPEVGSYSDYFWPSEDRIIPLCEDQVHANKFFALVAGSDFNVYDATINSGDVPTRTDTLNAQLAIQNRGLSDSEGPVVISIEALNASSILFDSGTEYSSLSARTRVDWDTQILPSLFASNGEEIGMIVSIHDDVSLFHLDTIRYIVGDSETIFFDTFEDGMSQWSSDSWGITSEGVGDNSGITDSPDGNYAPSAEHILTLAQEVDFTNLTHPFISFDAKWEIEDNWDFVRFQALTSDGWISLAGNYTVIGNGQMAQPAGEAGYDGEQSNWISETIDLSQLNLRWQSALTL